MHHVISFILRIAYAGAFGFILLWHTEDIIKYVPQLLGGLLMLECIAQAIELFVLKSRTKVHYGFFIAPGLILLYSLFLILFCKMEIDPSNISEVMGGFMAGKLLVELKIGGICFLTFLLSELVISCVFYKPLYQPKKFAEEQALKLEAEKAVEQQLSKQAGSEQKADKSELPVT